MGNFYTFSKIYAIGTGEPYGYHGTGNTYYNSGNFTTGDNHDYLGFGTGNYAHIPKQGHIVAAMGMPCNANGQYAPHSGNYWWSLEDEHNIIINQCDPIASGQSFSFLQTDIDVYYGIKTKSILHYDTGGYCDYYFVKAIIIDE